MDGDEWMRLLLTRNAALNLITKIGKSRNADNIPETRVTSEWNELMAIGLRRMN